MGRVVGDISMSLDGFVTGPGADLEHGLGQGAAALHTWATASEGPGGPCLAGGVGRADRGRGDGAAVAARERDVVVMGGGQVVGSCLRDGLLDELRIHLAPIVLGSGTPLFRAGAHPALTQREVRVSPTATHLVYDVRDRRVVRAGR